MYNDTIATLVIACVLLVPNFHASAYDQDKVRQYCIMTQ